MLYMSKIYHICIEKLKMGFIGCSDRDEDCDFQLIVDCLMKSTDSLQRHEIQ